jgi:hypothetical protein
MAIFEMRNFGDRDEAEADHLILCTEKLCEPWSCLDTHVNQVEPLGDLGLNVLAKPVLWVVR